MFLVDVRALLRVEVMHKAVQLRKEGGVVRGCQAGFDRGHGAVLQSFGDTRGTLDHTTGVSVRAVIQGEPWELADSATPALTSSATVHAISADSSLGLRAPRAGITCCSVGILQLSLAWLARARRISRVKRCHSAPAWACRSTAPTRGRRWVARVVRLAARGEHGSRPDARAHRPFGLGMHPRDAPVPGEMGGCRCPQRIGAERSGPCRDQLIG